MPLPVAAVPVFSWFKALVFGLLALNAAIFVLSGTISEGLDSVAWLALLVLFEIETSRGPIRARRAAIIHGARLVAAIAIPVAAIGYLLDEEWLDATNAILWIAVVLMLEFQLRFPPAAARFRAQTTVVATALYIGLSCVAFVWLWRAEWFNAYDALLWLLAFATIEVNVLQRLRRWPARSAAPAQVEWDER